MWIQCMRRRQLNPFRVPGFNACNNSIMWLIPSCVWGLEGYDKMYYII